MEVLVIGSTGRLGSQVVNRALEAGHSVAALARNPAAVPDGRERLRVIQGDALDGESVKRAVSGCDAVVSCLGTKDRKEGTLRTEGVKNVVAAMDSTGARRLIVFSAFGVGDSRGQLPFMFGRVIMPLLLKASFGDMERMEEVVRASSLDWVLVRPTALTEKPAKGGVKVAQSPSEKVGSAIPIADVAGFMVEQLTSDAYVGKAPVIYV